MSISLAVDILQAVEHHQAHPEHRVDGPGVLAALEELVQVRAKSVNHNEPELDLVHDLEGHLPPRVLQLRVVRLVPEVAPH